MKRGIFQKIVGIISAVLLRTLLSFLIGSTILPFPREIGAATISLLYSTDAILQIGITVSRVFIAFLISFLTGIFIGILRGNNRFFEQVTTPYISFFQGIPPLPWALPLFFITGFFIASPIIVIGCIIVPLVVVNVTEGTKSIFPEYQEMLQVYVPGKPCISKNRYSPRCFPACLPH